MGDRHDYVALEWVKGEIAETLKQARQALESYVENPQDPTRMGFCLAYVHQVRGTLQMVEFYGAALLAEEMEYLAQALIDGKVSSQSEALEVLMQAILQLPAYLERIQSARRDLPLVVLPLLNDLRTARGEKLLSETSLFSPDLSQTSPVLPVDALARLRTAELPALLRKLRQMLQVALVGVIRNQDLPTNLGYLARVFARLESLCKDAPLGRLWVIASAMIEGLANGSIANGTSVRNLLRQVDREFKRLVDEGADAMNQPAPDELIKNLLFYVAKASDQSPRVRAVKDEYRLDDALPGAALVDEERARLAGPDRDAMRSVVGALCEELVRVKDSLDLFVRSDRSGVSELGSLLAPLKQIADTLAVLGFGQPRKVILDQIDVVSALAHGQREPNDATLMDVAGALLYVEATLAGMVGPSEEPGSEENVLPTTDVEQIHQVVIKEARNGLELAKDAIIEFIASQWNHEHLARVPELLTQVRGGLAMISQERAAKLLENCNRYIQEQLLVRQAVPDWHSLDTLADAITSVEYYLERLSEDHSTQGDVILDVAEESLDSLGYSLKPRPSILDAEPQAHVPAPLDNPLDEIDVLAAEPLAEPTAAVPVEDVPELAAPVEIADSLEPAAIEELQAELAQSEAAESEALDAGLAEPAAPQSDEFILDLADLDTPKAADSEDSFTFETLEPLVEPTAPQESFELPSDLDANAEAEVQPSAEAEQNFSFEPLELDSGLPATEPSADLGAWTLDDIEPLAAAPLAAELADLAAPAATLEPESLSWDIELEPAAPITDTTLADEGWSLDDSHKAESIEFSLDSLGDAAAPAPVDELTWSLDDAAPLAEAPALDEPTEAGTAAVAGQPWENLDLASPLSEAPAAPQALDDFTAPATLEAAPAPVDELAWDMEALTPAGDQPAEEDWFSIDLSQPAADSPAPSLELDEHFASLEPAPLTTLESLDDLSLDAQPVSDELPVAEAELVSDDNWTLGELSEPSALDAGVDLSLDAPLEPLAEAPALPAEAWSDANIAALDLPEVELPSPPAEPEPVAEAAAKPLSLAEVMAAPVQAINPPAQDVPPSLLPPPADEEPIDEELREVFIEEAGEVLEAIGEHLPTWLANTDDRDSLTEIRRAFHTLKGSGRMVRALVIGELAWSIENLLNRVLDRSIAASPAVLQVVQDVVALMPELVEEYAASAQRQRDDVDRLAATAHALAKGQPVPPPGGGLPEAELAAQDQDITPELADVQAIAAQAADEGLDDSLDPQLLEIFRNEAEAHLETLVGFLADCAQQLPQPVTDDLQRALHTLKGSAHMAGILPIAEIATPLERLVKEFKTNLLQVDLREAELLHAAEGLFRVGLDQLVQGRPLAPIEGSPELLARIAQIHQERLEAAEAKRRGESGEGSGNDPHLIGMFLAEGMDILLDAEDLLRRWREHPQERQELGALHDELETLSRGAQMAELPQMAELADALLAVYGAVRQGRLETGEAFFSAAETAHEALIGMMDQVAAALQVSARPEQVEALHRLLDAPAPELAAEEAPDALDVEFVDLENLTAEDFPAEDDEFLLDSRPVDDDNLPDGLSWSPRNDNDGAPRGAADDDDDDVITAETPHAHPAPQAPRALDEEMVAIFLEEAVDILDNAGQALEQWLASPAGLAALSTLQRDLHTLKGGARMAEIREIGDLSHELESLYEGLLDHRFQHSQPLGELLRTCHDRLATQLDQLQAGQPLTDPADLVQTIRTFRQNPAAGLAAPQALAAQPEQEAVAEEEAVEQLQVSEVLIELELPAEAAPEADAAEESGVADLEAIDLERIDLDSADVGSIDLDSLDAEDAATPVAAEPEPQAPTEDLELQAFLEQAEAEVAEQQSSEAEAIEPAAAAADATGVQDSEYELDADRDQELVEIFLEEGFDILESSSAALHRWMENPDNSVALEALQRDLHTLKGGARMAEIRPIGDLAHELEFLYEGLCGGRLRASPTLFQLLQRCHDRLAEMLEAVQQHRRVPGGESLIDAIRRFRANPEEQLSIPSSVSLQAISSSQSAAEGPEADILDIFLEEADDLLEGMEQALGRWDAERENGALDELLRILHTLKGGARLAGQSSLGDLAHDLEQHLGEAQQQGAPWPESLLLDVQSGFEGLQAEVDQLRLHLGEVEVAELDSEPEPLPVEEPAPPSLPALPEAIMAAATPQRVDAPVVLPFVRRAQEAAQEAAARRAPQELVKVPAQLLEGLVNLAGETSIFRGRVEQQVSDVGSTLGEMDATIERVRDQLRRLDTETQAQILSRHQADAERAGYEEFDPLEMDRYSQLQQLSRALFESASDLFDLKETLAAKNRDAETLLLQQARVNTELQEGLMRTRMVPFDRLVPRLRRIVRQVASELGKQVEFVVSNAEGEMDRTVLERIVAPLEHMLRNAVDHGIESGDARRSAGKPEQGTIRLTLGREGGDILLTLADDGAGIRLEAVRRKAIERGLMAEDSELNDHEVLQFILEAGFSTAEKVTQISGRGVGMDVVNSEVKQLGGSMSIHSAVGEGTRFDIRLPFTVSVNRALMVLSGEDLYALPLNTIEGIVRVSPYELEALYEQAAADESGAAPRFEYAGQSYELKYLGDLLNNGQHPKLVGQSLPLPVILVRSADHAVAVQVDALAGSREIVVKSLGAQFAGVSGISGATILGDGRVVVILDLLATIRVLHAQLVQHAPRRQLAGPSVAELEHQRPTLVMVVDDSVTVRKVTSRLLERNGMNVLTAKDGVDAIAQLQEHKPDIMLLDIEMPRMDGFEVATLVRHDEQLKDLPIIMITSRTGEKHRDRALAIGVNQYLGKPYQESELLESIQQLVKSHV
ncbi:chemosensory pili system protein ChpA (sensor histidine kinase/response regulator) [Pseudomonas nitritireducens]|uniref:Chemotaxis protein CheA n=1 Tax=Pseudomonas nitroreducens TaxID=46680 RepID=A0A7W7KL08_PSENT|nr:Hpt domain-containing protein [Pseudomonas nitritireducens]MBB4864283.1 chemosensory pili system protein ChpA (sensor histidine kinase/response regulator) [Pseudomonas nitritireducens]